MTDWIGLAIIQRSFVHIAIYLAEAEHRRVKAVYTYAPRKDRLVRNRPCPRHKNAPTQAYAGRRVPYVPRTRRDRHPTNFLVDLLAEILTDRLLMYYIKMVEVLRFSPMCQTGEKFTLKSKLLPL